MNGKECCLELVSQLKDSGRNIVLDNFFTSVPIAVKLLNWGMTITSTIRKNKREIPEYLKQENFIVLDFYFVKNSCWFHMS